MKKFALLFILVAGFAVAHAQQAPAAAKAENNGPVMYLSTTTVDFGTIEQDSEPYRKLPFENRGNSPLIITNAKGSCGCTVPTWPKEPIMPGATDTMTIRYDTHRIGAIRKTVTVYTNQGDQPLTIQVIGQINAKPAEPEALPEKKQSVLGTKGNN
ncbi:MAG: DUF1573 domain-containing protein [Saprospiraceae bacterium]|nr:DUF1573 domain-containing protein [Saprospiraceae bacterium]